MNININNTSTSTSTIPCYNNYQTTNTYQTITGTATGTSYIMNNDYSINIKPDPPLYQFEYIKEYVKDKVYEFTFTDGTKIKTVCDKDDHFDLEYAFYLAIAKKLYSKNYTLTGVSWKTSEMYFQKKYIKAVKKGMKLFKKLQEEEQKKKEQDETKKRQHERYVRRKKASKERKRKEQINIITEAIRLSKEGE